MVAASCEGGGAAARAMIDEGVAAGFADTDAGCSAQECAKETTPIATSARVPTSCIVTRCGPQGEPHKLDPLLCGHGTIAASGLALPA